MVPSCASTTGTTQVLPVVPPIGISAQQAPRAIDHIRPLRGGAQAQLMRCDDGEIYAVKFRTNPQGRRILVNEWIAAAVFQHLRLATPKVAAVEITEEFLACRPELGVQTADGSIEPFTPGLHFGSRLPGDTEKMAIYDFLPGPVLQTVANLQDFRGAVVADRWLGNTDTRQAVFFRGRARQFATVPLHGSKVAFVTHLIDHGSVFSASCWDFPDLPLAGLYKMGSVYGAVSDLSAFEPWLSQILHFPERVLTRAIETLPASWVAQDKSALDGLIEQLLQRRSRVPGLIRQGVLANPGLFPAWSR